MTPPRRLPGVLHRGGTHAGFTPAPTRDHGRHRLTVRRRPPDPVNNTLPLFARASFLAPNFRFRPSTRPSQPGYFAAQRAVYPAVGRAKGLFGKLRRRRLPGLCRRCHSRHMRGPGQRAGERRRPRSFTSGGSVATACRGSDPLRPGQGRSPDACCAVAASAGRPAAAAIPARMSVRAYGSARIIVAPFTRHDQGPPDEGGRRWCAHTARRFW